MCHAAAVSPPVAEVSAEAARQLYARAKQLDNWPGESYEGSSVLAAAKAAVELGWFTGYRWAFCLGDLTFALSTVGPAVLGIYWYDGMEPDASGRVRPSGALAGSHAILANGVDFDQQLVRLHNSWGPSWGSGGECFISFADLAPLLMDRGEACVPIRTGFDVKSYE